MRKILSISLFLLNVGFISQAQAANVESVFLQTYTQIMKKVEKDPTFWPGLKLDSRPTVLKMCVEEPYNQQPQPGQQNPKVNCHLYAFHFKPGSDNWQKLTINKEDVYYNPKDTYGIEVTNGYRVGGPLTLIKRPSRMIDGQLSFVSSVLLYDPSRGEQLNNVMEVLGQKLLAHLLHDAPSADARLKQAIWRMHAGYTGFNQNSNVAMLYLETEIMKAYLKRPSEDKLKSFVAVETVRKASATEQMLAYEYADVEAFLAYPYAKLTDQAADHVQDYYYWLQDLKEKYFLDYFEVHDYTYRALGLISAASVVALENVDSSWKASIQSKVISAQELLMQHYSLDQAEVNRRVNAMKVQYQFDDIKKALDDKLQGKWADAQVHLKRYQEMAGVVMHVTLSHDLNIGVNVNYELDSETSLAVCQRGSGSAYGIPVILGYSGVSYIKVRRDFENSIDVLELKLQPEATVSIDGVQTTVANLLAAKQVTVFKHFTVKGNDPYNGPMTMEVGSETGGKIDAAHGTLEITR